MADTNVVANKTDTSAAPKGPAWRENEPDEVPSKDTSTDLDELGYTESFDLLPLDKLRAIADKRGVTIPWDVEKALLITELRAHQSGATSVARARGA